MPLGFSVCELEAKYFPLVAGCGRHVFPQTEGNGLTLEVGKNDFWGLGKMSVKWLLLLYVFA